MNESTTVDPGDGGGQPVPGYVWAIIGIVLVAGVAVLAELTILIFLRRKKNQENHQIRTNEQIRHLAMYSTIEPLSISQLGQASPPLDRRVSYKAGMVSVTNEEGLPTDNGHSSSSYDNPAFSSSGSPREGPGTVSSGYMSFSHGSCDTLTPETPRSNGHIPAAPSDDSCEEETKTIETVEKYAEVMATYVIEDAQDVIEIQFSDEDSECTDDPISTDRNNERADPAQLSSSHENKSEEPISNIEAYVDNIFYDVFENVQIK